LVRPDGKILDFRRDTDDFTDAEDKIYGKVFELIGKEVENHFEKKGELDTLYEDLPKNLRIVNTIYKYIN
jgi:hypothetical protein